ncbi:uncharacterized protein [Nicotiana sylvestris]|uniref:uncharacterized protein n=1 Tax=Nicotiana sylvestris TaxID=4096 RepID=UPI00388C471B
MDKNWLLIKNRTLPEYLNGVEYFLNFALSNPEVGVRIQCPCIKCNNVLRKSRDEVKTDLLRWGIDPTYDRWIYHGEPDSSSEEETNSDTNSNLGNDDARTFEMLHDMYRGVPSNNHEFDETIESRYEEPNTEAKTFYRLLKDAEQKLYPDCEKFSKLSFVMRLFQMKCLHSWSNTSFDSLLKLLSDALPKGNMLPNSIYEVQKIIKDLGLDYVKIDACVNNCVLYRKEYADLEQCPKCPRNVRLGLASDGFNPFGSMSNAYSMWPLVLIPYNLPPWICMKQSNILLSLLIPGPKSPGMDIDVYLQPLIDDLKTLWESGVETYDAFKKQNFHLRATLLWTINDFPAYGMLSGWSTKGKLACPVCHVHTCSIYLKHGRKHCYMGHRRFLEINHPYRRNKSSFDNTKEERLAPQALSGDDVLAQLNTSS